MDNPVEETLPTVQRKEEAMEVKEEEDNAIMRINRPLLDSQGPPVVKLVNIPVQNDDLLRMSVKVEKEEHLLPIGQVLQEVGVGTLHPIIIWDTHLPT